MARMLRKNSSQMNRNIEGVTKTEWIKLTISTGFIIFVMFIFSIGLTFYQRWFLQQYRIPMATVSCHLVIKFLLSILFRRIFQCLTGKKRIVLSWSTNFAKLAPVGFAAGLDVGFSNWGLELITVSLYTMTKSTSIVFILLFAILFRLEKKTWGVFLIVLMISSGLFLFTYQSTQFNFTGFILTLLASFVSGLRWTMAQFVMTQTNPDLRNPIDMMFHIQLWMFLIVAPLSFIFEGSAVQKLLVHSESLFELFVLIISGAMIAFALEIAEFLVLMHTSSLTLAVSGIVKETCTLVLAYEWNGDKMTVVNFVGLLICLGGIVSHVIYKAKQVDYNRFKRANNDSSATFVPILNYSSDEDSANFDEDSATEVLFNILQIGEKPR